MEPIRSVSPAQRVLSPAKKVTPQDIKDLAIKAAYNFIIGMFQKASTVSTNLVKKNAAEEFEYGITDARTNKTYKVTVHIPTLKKEIPEDLEDAINKLNSSKSSKCFESILNGVVAKATSTWTMSDEICKTEKLSKENFNKSKVLRTGALAAVNTIVLKLDPRILEHSVWNS